MQERSLKHIIVGSGFGGLCFAAQLKLKGEHDFVILEKARSIGGTWRENIYPGAECDVPSSLYSYSFFKNPDWPQKWSGQKDILKYINAFANAHDLEKHFRFGQTVESATYESNERRWHIKTGTDSLECRFLTFAVGQLHHPRYPEIPGIEAFAGESTHSAAWDTSIDFKGKSVAVIGSAASAVQLIPEVAAQASKMTVYQRSPNCCLPKNNRAYSAFEKKWFRRLPILQSLYRSSPWVQGEYGLYRMIRGNRMFSAIGEWLSKRQLRELIDDPELRRALTPDYPIGAKTNPVCNRFSKSAQSTPCGTGYRPDQRNSGQRRHCILRKRRHRKNS